MASICAGTGRAPGVWGGYALMEVSEVHDEAEREPGWSSLSSLFGLSDLLLDVYRTVVGRPGWGSPG